MLIDQTGSDDTTTYVDSPKQMAYSIHNIRAVDDYPSHQMCVLTQEADARAAFLLEQEYVPLRRELIKARWKKAMLTKESLRQRTAVIQANEASVCLSHSATYHSETIFFKTRGIF